MNELNFHTTMADNKKDMQEPATLVNMDSTTTNNNNKVLVELLCVNTGFLGFIFSQVCKDEAIHMCDCVNTFLHLTFAPLTDDL